jgi:hypothetical protein
MRGLQTLVGPTRHPARRIAIGALALHPDAGSPFPEWAPAAKSWEAPDSLNPKPLPPLQNPDAPSTPAKELFVRKSTPFPGPSRSIGGLFVTI